MNLAPRDIAAFAAYFIVVVVVAVVVSRRERDAADYFLAGRNLKWWLIGISLIASNISTEHFVGMAGAGVDFGLAMGEQCAESLLERHPELFNHVQTLTEIYSRYVAEIEAAEERRILSQVVRGPVEFTDVAGAAAMSQSSFG